jgi:hypothetical protein
VGTSAHQFFSAAGALIFFSVAMLRADLVTGDNYPVIFADVDGHNFSTADGRITLLVLTTSADADRARAVADRVPDYCLANPDYRMITIANLTGKYARIARRMVTWLVRQRLNAEAKRLQKRYDARQIQRDARRDVFAVADFDGTVTSQLGTKPEASEFRVFVFGRNGKLLSQWNDVPDAKELDAALH